MKFTAMSATYKIGGLSAAFGRVDSYNTIDVVQHPLNIKTYVIEAKYRQNRQFGLYIKVDLVLQSFYWCLATARATLYMFTN